jgi:hypothetical protein
MTNKAGRPIKEVNWTALDAALQYGGTLIDCAEILGMSEDSIQNKIKAEHNCTFSEYRHKKMGRMRMKLLQKQYEVAMKGNVALLIWLGKQHLGQTENAESKSNSGQIHITLSNAESRL